MARKKKDGEGETDKSARDALIDRIVAQILASESPQLALGSVIDEFTSVARAAGELGPDPVTERRNRPIELPAAPSEPVVLTVRVDLRGAKPPIWRRVELRGELTLEQVHATLQAVLGWSDSHLHRFQGPGVGPWDYPHFVAELDELDDGDEVGTPERDARLDQVLRAPGETLFYTYDFGDDWVHRLHLESVRPATASDPSARCTAGRRAGPQEDVGGIGAWNDLSDALRADPDPAHLSGDLQMYAEWLAPRTAPDAFDVDEANDALAWVGGPPADGAGDGPAGRAHGPAPALVGADGGSLVLDVAGAHLTVTQVLRRSHPLAAMALHRQAREAAQALRDGPPPSGAELAAALRPWSVVLQTAGAAGIALTKAGWMVPAACERIWRESGVATGHGKGNREQHCPELMLLRSECLRANLIRTYKGRLMPTPLGRTAISDDQVLAGAVAASLVRDTDDFGRDARVVALLLLATGWLPDPADVDDPSAQPLQPPQPLRTEQIAFRAEIARVLSAIGWQQDGGPVQRYGPAVVSDILTLLTAGAPYPDRFRRLPRAEGVRHLARLALFPDVRR